MPQIVCILAREWGQKVRAAGAVYDIPEDGSPMEVSAEAAEVLLANRRKWRDPDDLEPDGSNQAPSVAAILVDSAGRMLSEEETAKVVGEAKADPPPAETTEPDADPPPAEDEEESWPEVSMDMTKDELLEVARQIESAQPELADTVRTTGTKQEILDSIEAAYEAME